MQVLDKTPESVLTLIPAFRSLASGLLPIAWWCARQVSSNAREESRQCRDLPQSADHQTLNAESAPGTRE
jgi:hypothetical protein